MQQLMFPALQHIKDNEIEFTERNNDIFLDYPLLEIIRDTFAKTKKFLNDAIDNVHELGKYIKNTTNIPFSNELKILISNPGLGNYCNRGLLDKLIGLFTYLSFVRKNINGLLAVRKECIDSIGFDWEPYIFNGIVRNSIFDKIYNLIFEISVEFEDVAFKLLKFVISIELKLYGGIPIIGTQLMIKYVLEFDDQYNITYFGFGQQNDNICYL